MPTTEVRGAVEGAVRHFALVAPFPTGSATPHDLVRPHETAVYEFSAADGELLYVGISWNPFKRWASHRRRATWWNQATRVQVSVVTSEREALRIERERIRTASPRWNVRSASG